MANKIYVVETNRWSDEVSLIVWHSGRTDVEDGRIGQGPKKNFEDICRLAVKYAMQDNTFAFINKTSTIGGMTMMLELIWPAPPGSREGE